MITCVGSYGVGITFRVPRVPERGETVDRAKLSMGHGGKSSNQAIAAARQGARVSLITATGDDSFGESAKELWHEEGIDCSGCAVIADTATMAGMILVEADGANRIAIASGALEAVTPAFVDHHRSLIESADVVVVTLEIPIEAAERAIEIAHESGAVIILNPAPASDLRQEIIGMADYFVPNETEFEFYSKRGYVRTENQKLIVTMGAQGARIESDDGFSHYEPIEPGSPVVDTTGAGDTFVGSLSAAIDSGLPIAECITRAIAASALSVAINEVVPSIPSAEAVTAVLEEVGRA